MPASPTGLAEDTDGSKTGSTPEVTSSVHGVAAWPFGAGTPREARPDTLPDGRPWPRVRVITLLDSRDGDLAATLASVAGQGYIEAFHEMVAAGPCASATIVEAIADRETDYLLFLRADDLLAPGALIALSLEAALSSADAVAGLRVLFDETGVLGLDVLAAQYGLLDPREARQAFREQEAAPFTGGEILFRREAVAKAGGLDPALVLPVADLWLRLAAVAARVSRIGRPVLLQREANGGASRPSARGLSVAALTDLGYRGGAGIAHRRLTEALALAGHRITHLRLADEVAPAAAEWTDSFPRTEASAAGHDLVLAGNLHGATRRTAILGRLARQVPVAAVTHDLFAVTGRCAHPKGCPVIATGCDARCPSSSEYPQLAPERIAGAYAERSAVLATPHAPLLLANSDWTASRVRELAPPGTGIARISLAFPTGVFCPGDRTALRLRLGLPSSDVLIVFGAVIADAPDKGFQDLVATLRTIARPGIGFVALGRLDDPAALGVANLHAPGPIGDEARLAEWYAACDIHLTASRLETLGQTPIEAGLCGVPTVAYRTTGLTSAVIDAVTGILVEPRTGALTEALRALIADEPRRKRLGAFARIVLESRFSHAASALSLHDVFAKQGILPDAGTAPRVAFAPEMLGQFAFAAERHPGAEGTVASRSPSIVRWLRRAKHAIFGRGMPRWMRVALYAASLIRRAASHPVSRS